MPSVARNDLNSLRIVEIVATQGVYKRVNTRKLTAESGVNIDGRTAESMSALVPDNTASDETTASFAVKPDMSAVTTRQSPKPSGLKITAMNLPMYARILCVPSVT